MTQIPEGAQRSEDGNYWWDGTAWQLIDQSQGGGSGEQEGQEGQAQESEPRQKQVAAAGEPGGEAQAPMA